MVRKRPIAGDGRPSATWSIASPRALGEAMRALREEAGLTQGELAATTGTTRQRISRLEDGRASDQVRLLIRVLRRLGVVMQLAPSEEAARGFGEESSDDA